MEATCRDIRWIEQRADETNGMRSGVEIRADIFERHARGGHNLKKRKRPERLGYPSCADARCREQLLQLRAQAMGLHHFSRSRTPGHHRHTKPVCFGYDIAINNR